MIPAMHTPRRFTANNPDPASAANSGPNPAELHEQLSGQIQGFAAKFTKVTVELAREQMETIAALRKELDAVVAAVHEISEKLESSAISHPEEPQAHKADTGEREPVTAPSEQADGQPGFTQPIAPDTTPPRRFRRVQRREL